jgi:hypothetical protein
MTQEFRRTTFVGHSASKAARAVALASVWSWRLPTRLVLLMLTMPVLFIAALITLPFILLGGSHVGAASPADLLRVYINRLPLG